MGALKCYYYRVVIIAIVLITSCNCYSQENDYEYVNYSSWKWREDSELQYYNNSTAKLDVYNNHAETEDDKKNNKYSYKVTWIQIPSDKGKAYTILFDIKNENNPMTHNFKVYGKDKNGRTQEMWHENDIYWGLKFQYEDTNNKTQDYEITFCNERKMNGNYTHTQAWNPDQGWKTCSDFTIKRYRIEFDGISKIEIYTDDNSIPSKTLYTSKGLAWIGVKSGNAARNIVTNFSFKRKTLFATFLPEFQRAQNLINYNDYDKAISCMSKVLEIYKNALPYYYRARAYCGKEYYGSAIIDCNNGLNYNCETELRQNLYFIRGFSKIMQKDDSGISDMKQAGELGERFLRENNLLGNKSAKNSQRPRNNGSKTSSTNRIPQLKKTK